MFNVVSSGQWPAGYLINPNEEPLDQKWLKEFSKIPAAAVSDCLGRNYLHHDYAEEKISAHRDRQKSAQKRAMDAGIPNAPTLPFRGPIR